jgi:outer membrane protein OmpA-like peptidoglycan-associated protein
MNRMIKAAAVALAAGGAAGSVGCANADRPSVQDRYASYVDPCWPERYSFQARQAVIHPLAAQQVNGAVVDATVMEFMFEQGKDTLLPSGRQKLDYLARKRPHPERTIYVQTARDLVYDPATAEKFAADRQELDAKRVQAVQNYLTATTAGRGLTFDVQVIDLPDLTYGAQGPAAAVRGLPRRYQSGIDGGGIIGGTGAGGGGPNVSFIPVPGGAGGGGGGGTGTGGGIQ